MAGGHLSYVPGPAPSGKLRVGTIHSHAEAEAFHSPVDDGDEEHDDGLQVTVGNLDGPFSLSCSLVVDGRRFSLRSREVFESLSRESAGEVWYEALTHIHVEPPPGDSLDGRPSAI